MKSKEPNLMSNLILEQLKKLRTDAREVAKRMIWSWSQPNKGETEPKKARQVVELT